MSNGKYVIPKLCGIIAFSYTKPTTINYNKPPKTLWNNCLLFPSLLQQSNKFPRFQPLFNSMIFSSAQIRLCLARLLAICLVRLLNRPFIQTFMTTIVNSHDSFA